MDQIYPDDGLLYTLQKIAGGDAEAGLFWKLFQNNITPSLNDELADYTLAGAWGQEQVPLADFTLQQVTAHVGSVQAPNLEFTNTTGVNQSVYGYVITDETETLLVAAARFDGTLPIVIPAGGTQLVTPILGDYSALTT